MSEGEGIVLFLVLNVIVVAWVLYLMNKRSK